MLFHEYFADWIDVYKRGAVRPITFQKYQMTLQRLIELAPSLTVGELDRRSYQSIINQYGKTHEKQTTRDFHNHLKAVVLDAVDEGLLKYDPTRKVVIKGKTPVKDRIKYLSRAELTKVLEMLVLSTEVNWDWLILLSAKTGLRFAEILGLTRNDFEFAQNNLTISKTWDYKNGGGFATTKNESSKRTIVLDSQLSNQFDTLTNGLPPDKPIFVNGRVFNSTVNSRLCTLCKKADVPVISLHSLRHTHASLLIFAGVSIASIAKRLGHSSVTKTQETYLHIIQELESQDNDKIIRHLSSLM